MIDLAAQPLASVLRIGKESLAAVWLQRTLLTYPEHTAGFLRQERDPFRNPVGHALAACLPALVDELLGEMVPGRLTTALDPVIRVRAVQGFTPRQAVGFVFLLKPIVRESVTRGEATPPALVELEGRIDELALLAFDLYMGCRQRIHDIRVGELRRRLGVRGRDFGGWNGGNGG